jgi:hypothetical protein
MPGGVAYQAAFLCDAHARHVRYSCGKVAELTLDYRISYDTSKPREGMLPPGSGASKKRVSRGSASHSPQRAYTIMASHSVLYEWPFVNEWNVRIELT